MKTKEQCDELIAKSINIKKEMKDTVIEILKEHGEQVFDYEDGCAPSYASETFQDDICDVYVTRIYERDGLVFGDLHAYYIGDDRENVCISDEMLADWANILDYLKYLL